MEVFDHPSPTRRRLYHLLVEDHLSVARAAEILKVSRQTAHAHARQLEATGAVRRIGGTNPIAWERGPAGGAFLREARQSGGRGGRSPASAPRLAARFHRDAWRWKVRSGPRQDPPWTEEWVASGVENFAMRLRLKDGREFRLWEIRGKAQATIVIQPPDYLAYDAEDLHMAGRKREADVVRVARTFAEKYGYRFDGKLEVAQEAEAGVEIPGVELQNAGIPGRTTRWVDHSPASGNGEVETMSLSDTEKFLTYPDWRDTVDADIKAVKLALQDKEDRLAEIVELQRREVEQTGILTAVVSTEISARVKNGQP